MGLERTTTLQSKSFPQLKTIFSSTEGEDESIKGIRLDGDVGMREIQCCGIMKLGVATFISTSHAKTKNGSTQKITIHIESQRLEESTANSILKADREQLQTRQSEC